jgi:O-antigen/teichoic acid export membrane protein
VNAAHDGETLTVARNVSTRYLAIVIEMAVGLLVLPFNVAHLGKAAYGLWMLMTSITAYFSVLDLGYSGALVKFVAQYRARRDARALNEILSTLFYVFAAFGLATCVVAAALALSLGRLFHIAPDEIATGQIVLLVTTLTVAVGMPFTVFGAVINGFQRYDLNNVAGAVSSVVVAVVNVAVLLMGFGLAGLVIATTTVRLLTYWVYRANAYRVFPELRLRLRFFTRARLREVTTFSVYMLLLDWANKINYSVDALVIGAFLSTSAVAIWAIGQRLAEATQRLTNQLNDVLFPNVVDHDAASRLDRLQAIFLVATRLSLATVVPIGGVLILMADPLVRAWVGPDFSASALVVQLLSLIVIIRVGAATAGTVLKGAGRHRMLAYCNVTTAVANLVLSIALIGPLGLPGVALGTLAPVSITSLLVIFPAACRRVELPIGRALAEAVWPALWPAGVMALYAAATLRYVGQTLPAVGAEMIAAAVVYAVTFLAFGVSAAERRFCISKAHALLSRARWVAPSLQEGACER